MAVYTPNRDPSDAPEPQPAAPPPEPAAPPPEPAEAVASPEEEVERQLRLARERLGLWFRRLWPVAVEVLLPPAGPRRRAPGRDRGGDAERGRQDEDRRHPDDRPRRGPGAHPALPADAARHLSVRAPGHRGQAAGRRPARAGQGFVPGG